MPDDDRTASERRREFHRYPEPSWCEFYTTSRLVDAVESIGVDDLRIGKDAVVAGERLGVPDEAALDEWQRRAAEAGAREDVLDLTAGGTTGLVATLDRGPGPVVGLRVDVDALPVTEADDDAHAPAAGGFRSTNEGYMHACGHDAHMTIGLGVLERFAAREFAGTLTVCFQPAEEVLGGGKPMVETGLVDDVDCLFGVHVGLDHPTGTVVGGAVEPLAIRQTRATFVGESAHAGIAPNEGRDAIQAMATAIQGVNAIARHEDGLSRVNVGRAEGGTASNVVAETATIDLEVRAADDAVLDYLSERVETVLAGAAATYDCDLTTDLIGAAPRVDSDGNLASQVAALARDVDGVDTVHQHAPLGASEDATYFMERVQEGGGEATYVIVGTDHPSGHHTPRFDVDERSLDIGIDVLTEAIADAFERDR